VAPKGAIVAVVLAALCRGPSANASEGESFEQAVAEANKRATVVLVEFHADWCKPCKYVEREILPNARVVSALSQVVHLRVDADSDAGDTLQERFGVRVLPTFLVIDGSGRELERVKGLTSIGRPDQFAAFVLRVRQLGVAESDVLGTEAYKNGNPDALLEAGRWYEARGDRANAVEHFKRAVAADPEGSWGVGAEAAWAAHRIAEATSRRSTAVAAMVELVERFPGAVESTLAVERLVLLGDLEEARISRLFAEHLAGLDNVVHAYRLVFLAIAADRFTDAELALAKARSLRPRHPMTHLAAAELEVARGDKAKALEHTRNCRKQAMRRDWALCDRVQDRLRDGGEAPEVRRVRGLVALYIVDLEHPGQEGESRRAAIRAQMDMAGKPGTKKPTGNTARLAADNAEDFMVRPRVLVLAGARGGFTDGAFLGGRLMVPLVEISETVVPVVMLAGTAGGDFDGKTTFDANALLGAAVRHTNATFAAGIGVGASRFGDALPASAQLPVDVSLSVFGENFGAFAWSRLTFVADTDRRGGAEHGLSGTDELVLGAGVIVPRIFGKRWVVGISYREAAGGDSVGGWLGVAESL
jgi:thiol-disulfide isomerase/thioredoxin